MIGYIALTAGELILKDYGFISPWDSFLSTVSLYNSSRTFFMPTGLHYSLTIYQTA